LLFATILINYPSNTLEKQNDHGESMLFDSSVAGIFHNNKQVENYDPKHGSSLFGLTSQQNKRSAGGSAKAIEFKCDREKDLVSVSLTIERSIAIVRHRETRSSRG
jgi:hypothetical protein